MEESKPKEPIKFTLSLPGDLKLGPRARQVLALRFEHPEMTNVEIGKQLGISDQRVSQIIHHPKVLSALPTIAKGHITGMIPDAVKTMKDSIRQRDNWQVAQKSARELLTDRKILDAPEMVVKHDITLLNVGELKKIVLQASLEAKDDQPDVIDAEIIDEPK